MKSNETCLYYRGEVGTLKSSLPKILLVCLHNFTDYSALRLFPLLNTVIVFHDKIHLSFGFAIFKYGGEP